MLKSLHAKSIMIMFIVGSTVVMGVNTAAGQDSWFAVLIAAAFAAPVMLIYARLMKLYPEKGLFEIAEAATGKVSGKIVTALYTWYAFHLGALVLRNFVEFIQVNVLRETPRIAVMILFMSTTAYLIRSGLKTMGKIATISLSVVISIVIITAIGSVNQMELFYLLPVLSTDTGKLIESGYSTFAFPLAETVLFLTTAAAVRKEDSPYRIYLWSLVIATLILLAVLVRNLLILGPAMTGISYFPSFVAARIINIGDFFARIEGSIATNFMFSGIIKISVCLFAAATGVAKLAGLSDHKRLVLPLGILMMALSEIVYVNLMEMFAWLNIYKYYAIPFELIIPVYLWIMAEIKARKSQGIAT